MPRGEAREHRAHVGLHHLGFDGSESADEIADRTKQLLFRSLNMRRVVGFVGAGISQAYGYPAWDTLVSNVMRKALKAHPPSDPKSAHLLKELNKCLSAKKWPNEKISRVERYLLNLERCDEYLRSHGAGSQDRQEKLHDYIADAIRSVNATQESAPAKARERRIPASRDPLRGLIKDLRIHRFLTTNYDMEIERALAELLDCPCPPLWLDTEKKAKQRRAMTEFAAASAAEDWGVAGPHAPSLIFDSNRPDALINFAVKAPGYDAGVFHLHGAFTTPESLIATSSDYQRAYLQEDLAHRTYQDAIDLILSGNAILFVGYGLEEADLLEPLRRFVAQHQREAVEWPFFAIMPRPSNKAEVQEYWHHLHTRFGIKALYYDTYEGMTPHKHAKSLCDYLSTLSTEWQARWLSWQQMPRLRKPCVVEFGKGTRIHHRVLDQSVFRPETDYEQLLREVCPHTDTPNADRKAVVVYGRSGTGKGTLAHRLVSEGADVKSWYPKRFYSTAHFTNEFLSSIQCAAEYFGRPHTASNGAPASVCALLRNGIKHEAGLLVLGGIERLLVPESPNSAAVQNAGVNEHSGLPKVFGRAINREAAELLRILTGGDGAASRKTQVVLTTSVWPSDLAESSVRKIVLTGLSLPEFQHPPDSDWRRKFFHAVGGHLYACSLVEYVLREFEDENWLRRLVCDLTAIDLPRRPEETVRAVIDRFCEHFSRHRLAVVRLLSHVAFFGTPIDEATLQAVDDGASDCDLLRYLCEWNLLISVAPLVKQDRARYTVHSLVRSHLLHELGYSFETPGEPQRFTPTDYASEMQGIQVQIDRGHMEAARTSSRLINQAEGSLEGASLRSSVLATARSAYSLVRSRWTVLKVLRLAELPLEQSFGRGRSHLGQFQARIARLLNVARHMDGARGWSHTAERDKIECDNAVFYADEVAWLYNEMALSEFAKGSLHDAYPLLRCSSDLAAVVDPEPRGERWRQAEMNLGLVQLERARFSRAMHHLNNILTCTDESSSEDVDIRARALGYIALIHHLTGRFSKAADLYKDSIEKLESISNSRGISIFRRHRSDLLRGTSDLDEASKEIAASLAAAESGSHTDLVHYARIAIASLDRARARRGEAPMTATHIVFLDSATSYARRIGLPKMEADASTVHASIALSQGDVRTAGRMAVGALGLASFYGMRLRVTRNLVVLGRVLRAQGNAVAAAGVLRTAIALARRQTYTLQEEIAQHELHQISRNARDF